MARAVWQRARVEPPDCSDQGTLKYAVRSPSGWSVETADTQKSVGISELALGSRHQPYIAYGKTVDLGPGFSDELWIATKAQGVWTTTRVTDGRVWALDLALNAAGQPEIAYVVDTGAEQIVARIARFDGTSWSFQDIGPVGEGGIEFGIDLLIDADGHEDVVNPVGDPRQGRLPQVRGVDVTAGKRARFHRATPTGGGWTTQRTQPR